MMKQYWLSFIFSLIFFGSFQAQTGITVPDLAGCDDVVQNFLNTYEIPGATFAIAKDGKLVYMRGFGYSDLDALEPARPYHLFRIGNISKSITAIALMKMQQDQIISLSDKVFGPNGILKDNPYLSSANVTDNKIYQITIQHLLDHSVGWDLEENCFPNPTAPYPWFIGGCDPVYAPLHVTQTFGEANPVTEEMLIRFLMENGTDFYPGTDFSYSNVGYIVLGKVIEAISGMPYEEYIKTELLEPMGICDMHLGKNLKENRLEREAIYYGDGNTTLSCYGTGQYVPWEYGGFNLEALDAAGGWIATARDLVKLILRVDGFNTVPDILNPNTMSIMTLPSPNNQNYAKGWYVNQSGNWWHFGSLNGTASFWARANNGYTWALILNKRVTGPVSNQFWIDLDDLPWECISNVSFAPNLDLLDIPTASAHSLSISNISGDGMTLSWGPGNGTDRILVARENEPVDGFPKDGNNYVANSLFGFGGQVDPAQFVVYNGNGFSVDLTNLKQNTTYYFRLFEYNKSSNTGNFPLYRLCNSPVDSATTLMVNRTHGLLPENVIDLFPNPTTGNLKVLLKKLAPGPDSRLRLINTQGQVVHMQTGLTSEINLNLQGIPSGVYSLQLQTDAGIVVRRIVKTDR